MAIYLLASTLPEFYRLWFLLVALAFGDSSRVKSSEGYGAIQARDDAAGGHRSHRRHVAEADLPAQGGPETKCNKQSTARPRPSPTEISSLEDIIRQHEEGKEFFIMLSGVATASGE